MRRAELIAMLTLAGCMRIYPDPELPDVKVEWFAEDCRASTDTVAVTLAGLDAPSSVTLSVPCSDLRVTFADVARERFHIEGKLVDPAGDVFSTGEGDVDIRNGFNERVGLYFNEFSNFRVAWTFPGGGTCESLGATTVAMFFALTDDPGVESFEFPCSPTRSSGEVSPGTYTAQLRASAGETVIAVSEETAPFEVTPQRFSDLGMLTIVPCGAACP